MPKLYILGGANGVGKTTWYQTGIEQKYITAELPFINVDTKLPWPTTGTIRAFSFLAIYSKENHLIKTSQPLATDGRSQ